MHSLDTHGYDAAGAARVLLELAGATITPQNDHAALPAHEAIVAQLRQAGVGARVVALQGAELRHLRFPAAVRLEDSTWAVLTRRTRGGYRVETPAGRSIWNEETLQRRGSLVAVEVVGHGTLARLLGRHASVIAQLLGTSVVVQLLLAAFPLLTRQVIDVAIPHGASSMLQTIALALLLTTAFQAWAVWLRGRALLHLQAMLELAVVRSVLRHLFRLPFRFFAGRTTGELLQSLSGIQSARELLGDSLLRALLDLLPTIVFAILMIVIFPGAATAMIAAGIVIALLTIVIGSRLVTLQQRQLAAEMQQRGAVLEMINGIETVKSAGAEERVRRAWSDIFGREVTAAWSRQRTALGGDTGADLLRQLLIATVLIWGGIRALGGSLSIGSLVAFLQLSAGFLTMLSGLAGAVVAVMVSRVHLARTHEVMRTEAEPPRPRTRSFKAPAVVIDDLWFRYSDGSPWIIESMSLTIGSGEIQRLSSPSGSGKTTLLRLLAGLYTPARGSVRIDGIEASLAGGVCYLPQFPQLLSGTIADNLRVFSGGAPHADVMHAATETGLHEWISSLPMGYRTLVTSRGANFSGGQRQWITLTAALASERKLLLLDEPMANLDPVIRGRIWRSGSLAGRTVIYAAHDEPAVTQAVS